MRLEDPAEHRILEEALEACERATGLRGRIAALPPGITTACRADAVVEFRDGHRRFRFAAAVKTVDRVAALGHARAQFKACPEPGLLVVRYMTEEQADNCRRLALDFIDTAGNAHLKADGLFVYVTGRKRPAAAPRPTFRAFHATGLRVIFALLCRPELLQATYREIQKNAGVALGTVGWVMNDLLDRGYLVRRDGRTRFMDAERLAAQWVEYYPLKLRPVLNARRFTVADPAWWQHDIPRDGAVYWGGEVGAKRLTGALHPEHFTLYVREEPRDLILGQRLRADLHGAIEILDAFWNFPVPADHPDVVPPLLVYADLVATGDQRNHEIAQQVYERHVRPTLH